MAKVLMIGGAGYVGSSVTAYLHDQGHQTWILDDLSTGYLDLVAGSGARGFTHAQAGNKQAVSELLSQQKFDCVMYFAARSLVGESVQKPEEYFENNVTQTEQLLEVLIASGHPGHRRFVFSSTCAVYGDPGVERIDETCAKKPISPYGQTKLAAEQLLERFARDQALQTVSLRYFNASGADPKGRVGEWHHPETHLIPRVLKACIEQGTVQIFGDDYETEDGTCVRDYVHVNDLARAHAAAMMRMIKLEGTPAASRGRFEAYNLGSEFGFSVGDIVEACARITNKAPSVEILDRRPGDPALLVADSQLAQKVLGFKIEHTLDEIISDAYVWEKKKSRMKRKAVFLDRDGTLNEDPGYLNDPNAVKILETVPEALAKLKAAGFLPIVVSNQSGINRGLVSPENLPKIHDKINSYLRPAGGVIFDFIPCIHKPDDGCDCRKPKPGLLLEAQKKFNLDLSRSYMIGDKASDIGAAKNAGVKASVLVRTGEGRRAETELEPGQATFIADSLEQAADWILSQGI